MSTDPLRGVCLERTIELDNVRLSVRDWPGLGGPLVHIPDPWRQSALVETIAASLAPRYRVLSLAPRPATAYQVWANDIVGVLSQFGFTGPVVLGEGVACVPAVVVAAWYPERVGRLILVDPRLESVGDDVGALSLRECPPDRRALRARLSCDVVELAADDALLVGRVEAVLAARLP